MVALLAAQGLPASRGFAVTPSPKAPKQPKSLQEKNKLAALERGNDFVDAIRTEPFAILPNLEPPDASGSGDDSGEVRLWRDIPDLETDRVHCHP